MVDLLVRVVGSAVIGWALGGAAGTVVSRTFTGGGAHPVIFIPLTMIVVFLASYALVPRPR